MWYVKYIYTVYFLKKKTRSSMIILNTFCICYISDLSVDVICSLNDRIVYIFMNKCSELCNIY